MDDFGCPGEFRESARPLGIGRCQQPDALPTATFHDPACRLLSLVGPGGSGKTRLALQAASEVVAAATDRFPDGVWFVPLASVTAGESIGPSIAQALGIALEPGMAPASQLLRVLRRKRLLLILDNYEHLLPATDLIEALHDLGIEGEPVVERVARRGELAALRGAAVAVTVDGNGLYAA